MFGSIRRSGRIFDRSRVLSKRRSAVTWYVTELGSQRSQFLAERNARLIAATTPLTVAEDRLLSTIQSKVGRQLDGAGASDLRGYLDSSLTGFRLGRLPGIDRQDLRILDRLNAEVDRSGRCRCAIVAVPDG